MLNEEEKQAIERLSSINENTEEYDGNLFKEDFNIILKLIQKQQDKIDILHATLAESVARTVCEDIKQSQKHKDDLEMLYKGCQIENEQLKETMYRMASFIASQDIECDICEHTGRLCECDSMAYGECENCIINYFKNSGK